MINYYLFAGITVIICGLSACAEFNQLLVEAVEETREERIETKLKNTDPQEPSGQEGGEELIDTNTPKKFSYIFMKVFPKDMPVEIELNGKSISKGLAPQGFGVPSNQSYRVRVDASGYKPCIFSFYLTAEERKVLECSLNEKYVSCFVDVNERKSSAYLSNKPNQC